MGHLAKYGSGTFRFQPALLMMSRTKNLKWCVYCAGRVSKTPVKSKYRDRSAGSKFEVQANVFADRREIVRSSGLIGGEFANDFAQPILNGKNSCLRQRQMIARQPHEQIAISN
jgi:hypothetical protein